MKTVLLLLLIAIITLFTQSCTSDKYIVTKYGAIPSDTVLSTEAIQAAIDDCQANGGGTVLVPTGQYTIGTIILKDSVTLHLEAGAELIGSIHLRDYVNIDKFTDAVGQERGNCLVGAVDAVNVGITGSGTITGRGEYFRSDSLRITAKRYHHEIPDNAYSKRPFLVRFVRCKNVEVKNITLQRPAAWTLHFFQCKGILVDGLTIISHSNGNNDGIDLDSSSDVYITNTHIDSGDDAMCFKATSPLACENITIKHCKLSSHWGAIKFGTESMGDFKNISIDSCLVYNTKGGGIKMLSVDGANISNISITNIEMNNVDMPIFIRLGERLRTYRNAEKQDVGSIDDISIKNITAKVWEDHELRVSPGSGIFITGTPNNKIGRLTLENIDISMPGGGTKEMRNNVVAEDETRYPEFNFFKVLPAFGLYVRHTSDFHASDIIINTITNDKRYGYYFTDINNASLVKCNFNGQDNNINSFRHIKAKNVSVKH